MKKKRKIKAWAMFLKAHYPVFVCAVEGLEGGRGGPPKNHAFAKYFEDAGQKIIWQECEVLIPEPQFTLSAQNKYK